MSSHFSNWDERTLDLAIDRFTVGVNDHEATQLDRTTEAADLQDLEATIAAIHLAELGELKAPPAEFLQRLEGVGRAQIAPGPRALPPVELDSGTSLPMRAIAIAGWLIAAGLLVSFLLFLTGTDIEVDARRRTLIADASDLILIDWSTTEDPAANGVTGDVVWSSDRQEGFMRFQDLEPNDPSKSQYQLWIFDTTRADWEAKPVDGGVFDVSADGEVVVPIDAKLTVSEPALFAITVEVPGGVVVSEREHLILTAAL